MKKKFTFEDKQKVPQLSPSHDYQNQVRNDVGKLGFQWSPPLITTVGSSLDSIGIVLNTSCSKRLHKKRVSWYQESSWLTIATLSPFIEMTKKYQFQNFSCLFTFYGSSKSESDPNWGCKKTKSPSSYIALPVICKSINISIFRISWKKFGMCTFEAKNSLHEVYKFWTKNVWFGGVPIIRFGSYFEWMHKI